MVPDTVWALVGFARLPGEKFPFSSRERKRVLQNELFIKLIVGSDSGRKIHEGAMNGCDAISFSLYDFKYARIGMVSLMIHSMFS